MIVGDAVGEVGKPFPIAGLWRQPCLVEPKTDFVVREWCEHVGCLNQFSGHVDGVSTVDDDGVERLKVFQPRDAHDLNR